MRVGRFTAVLPEVNARTKREGTMRIRDLIISTVIAMLLSLGDAGAVDIQVGVEGFQLGTGGMQIASGGGGGGTGTLPVFASAGSTNTSSVTTASTPVDTTNATLIGACVSGVVTSFNDNAGNVYVPLTTVGGNPGATPYYKLAPVTNAAHTWTATGSFNSIAIVAVSGITGAPIEIAAGGVLNGTAATSSAGITPSAANSLILACAAHDGDTASIDNGFTAPTGVSYLGGAHYGVHLSIKVPAPATLVNPQWTGSVRNWRVTLASFAP